MISTFKITGDRIREYLSEGKRFDGRKPDEFREITIETGVSEKAEGSAKVKIGDTEVIVGVKLGVDVPYPDSPDKGNLMVTTELLQLSSPRFEGGKPGFDSIEIGRIIDRGLRETKFIEFEKLCIQKGEKVWTIFVDIYSINDDGNLLDAAGIGAIAALRTAKMPKYDEKAGKILYGESDGKIPLSKETPVSVTVHKIGKHFLVDPTREEEDVNETKVTLGSSGGFISSMQKGDESSITLEDFKKILEIGEKVGKDVSQKIEKAFKGKN